MTYVDITPAALDWLAHGERGLSSEAIFEHMTGLPISAPCWRGWVHTPSDGDDFKRCEKLLRHVPEFRTRLREMADVSPYWAALVERWDEIVALLESEIPGVYEGATGSAPETYRLMKDIEAGSRNGGAA